uniref:C-type lectin domain-containing protein n=1 Tax=Branchiostoma floridae TaxID=7739 RepID=C3YWY5_BRAFL|eukprot:XP_002599367.1 hypothetical protein BRAFLDRAFT_200104 [Branchiostoma floridae]
MLLTRCFLASCPNGYTMWHAICYKAFHTPKTYSGANATCGEDGGTLAMPRDAGIDAFLISLHNAVNDKAPCWFGLHDRREEGSFEWVDGSALGTYSSWAPGEPNNLFGKEDCVMYSNPTLGDRWNDAACGHWFPYICQAVPGTGYNRPIS